MLTCETSLVLTWVVQGNQTYAIAGGCARSRYATEASQLRRFLSLLPVQQKDKTQIGIYLVPVDLKNRTRLAYELEATSEADKKVSLATIRIEERTFKAGDPSGWGFPEFLNEAALKWLEKTHKLVITCKITWADGEAAPIADRSDFFHKFEFSDVALVAADAQPPVFVQSSMLRRSEHFKTILDSEFSESNSTARLSPSRSIAPDERFSGDVDEFAAFGVPEPPGQDEQPQQDAAASEKDDAPEQQAKQDQLASPPDSARGESVRAEEQKNLRDFRLVKVPDCSYATLAAYLSYLYSSSFDFLPSPSVLLAEDKEPVSLTKSDFSKWADEQAKSRNYPVLPHAMYRLADCYMEPKVKKRAKEWILQHIKAETAPFELFSQLSLDYPDFQDDVVDFVVANLVLATPGWERAVTLVNEGKIPDGARILNKVLSKSRKAAA